jgi:hypothetical protein
MPKKRLSELSLRARRVLFSSKLELSPRQRGKFLHISRDQWQRPTRTPPLSPLAPNVVFAAPVKARFSKRKKKCSAPTSRRLDDDVDFARRRQLLVFHRFLAHRRRYEEHGSLERRTRTWTSAPARPNTRVKDLPDIALLATRIT